jgi:hypothetical protein
MLVYGNCYHQIGTWDPAGTNFIPTGGLWEISYRGVMQADYSLHLHLVGSGLGGSLACTAYRFLPIIVAYQRNHRK